MLKITIFRALRLPDRPPLPVGSQSLEALFLWQTRPRADFCHLPLGQLVLLGGIGSSLEMVSQAMKSLLLELLRNSFIQSLNFFLGLGLGYLWQRWRLQHLRRRLQELQRQRGQIEVVLILSCREDIRPSVEVFLRQRQGTSSQLPKIFQVHRPQPFDDRPEEWEDYVKQMRQEIHRLRQWGPTRILLFSNLPVAMAMAAGALLDNGPEVIVHHYFNGIYLPVLRLAHETVGLGRVNLTDHRPPPPMGQSRE
jgi:hypothetical protein